MVFSNRISTIILFGAISQTIAFRILYLENRVDLDFELVSREGWSAREPAAVEDLETPVPFVIIHHSYNPKACNTSEQCILAMQSMQTLHMDINGWNDIGYSFAVGGDGKAYEGRGWTRVGAHAPWYNFRSIGICVIGDWVEEVPPENQLETVHKLIQYGVDIGRIQQNYTLFGHRQVRDGTECPGDALFEEINTWSNFGLDPPYVYYDNSV